ncbi:MAG: hypothetical protein H7263_10710, partial [Candidatus Sericytochromatia bacterium]|nr:hypothetical protein [Candidatus Sericytochromatia bacterium]
MEKKFSRINLVCLSLSIFIYSCTPTQLNTAVENKTNEKNKVNTVVFTPQPIASISVQNNTPITV